MIALVLIGIVVSTPYHIFLLLLQSLSHLLLHSLLLPILLLLLIILLFLTRTSISTNSSNLSRAVPGK